jgi:Tetracyclin repressor-like, C-terminal domain
MARYVLQIEPLASASPDELVAAIGPTVQRYLTGAVDLPGPAAPTA